MYVDLKDLQEAFKFSIPIEKKDDKGHKLASVRGDAPLWYRSLALEKNGSENAYLVATNAHIIYIKELPFSGDPFKAYLCEEDIKELLKAGKKGNSYSVSGCYQESDSERWVGATIDGIRGKKRLSERYGMFYPDWKAVLPDYSYLKEACWEFRTDPDEWGRIINTAYAIHPSHVAFIDFQRGLIETGNEDHNYYCRFPIPGEFAEGLPFISFDARYLELFPKKALVQVRFHNKDYAMKAFNRGLHSFPVEFYFPSRGLKIYLMQRFFENNPFANE